MDIPQSKFANKCVGLSDIQYSVQHTHTTQMQSLANSIVGRCFFIRLSMGTVVFPTSTALKIMSFSSLEFLSCHSWCFLDLYSIHCFSMVMIFMGLGWPIFSKKYLDVVSARFTARSIFCEIATGDRLRVAYNSH